MLFAYRAIFFSFQAPYMLNCWQFFPNILIPITSSHRRNNFRLHHLIECAGGEMSFFKLQKTQFTPTWSSYIERGTGSIFHRLGYETTQTHMQRKVLLYKSHFRESRNIGFYKVVWNCCHKCFKEFKYVYVEFHLEKNYKR